MLCISLRKIFEKSFYIVLRIGVMGIILDFVPIVPRDLSGQAHKILHNLKNCLVWDQTQFS